MRAQLQLMWAGGDFHLQLIRAEIRDKCDLAGFQTRFVTIKQQR